MLFLIDTKICFENEEEFDIKTNKSNINYWKYCTTIIDNTKLSDKNDNTEGICIKHESTNNDFKAIKNHASACLYVYMQHTKWKDTKIMKWLMYSIAWISTSIVATIGVYITKSILCLLLMLIPAFLSIISTYDHNNE